MSFIKFSFLDYALPGQFGFQSPASPIMRGIIDLHHHIMFFLIIIIIFTFCMLYYTLENFSIITFNKVDEFFIIKRLFNVKITHNTILETLWIIIPSLILISIALPSFALLYAMDMNISSSIALKVIGHQWYWSYEVAFELPNHSEFCLSNDKFSQLYKKIYDWKLYVFEYNFESYMVVTDELLPNNLRLLSTTNPIVLPYKTYIKLAVTASDVLHSWTIPSLGVKIDAVPGRLNQVMIYMDRIGHFYGQCSELCGVNHGFMPIEIYAVNYLDYLIYLTYMSEDFSNYIRTFTLNRSFIGDLLLINSITLDHSIFDNIQSWYNNSFEYNLNIYK